MECDDCDECDGDIREFTNVMAAKGHCARVLGE